MSHDDRPAAKTDPVPAHARRSPSLAIVDAPPPPRFWRSPEELAGSAELREEARYEFPPGADTLEDGVSRRSFVQLLGASLAVSGAAACQRPNQPIVPYVRRPPEVTPGNPLHFATAHALDGFGVGLVVESHAGRPTKVEGNPDHPQSRGATSVYEQLLPQGLYDDDRAKAIRHAGGGAAWVGLLAHLAREAERLDAADGGAKLRFLVEPSASPLIGDLRARILQRFPNAKFVAYSSVAGDGAAAGAKLAFGQALEARHDLGPAAVIAALDADFLTDGPEQIVLARQFAERRKPGAEMNRLYAVEPCLTPTGAMADHRLRARGSQVLGFARALAAALAGQPGLEGLKAIAGAGGGAADPIDARFVAVLAKDLAASRGRGVVIAGRRQPAAVHAIVAAINHALGNVGRTVHFARPARHDEAAGAESLGGLVLDIAAGKVDTLVITAQNPVYGAPVDFKLAQVLERVPNTYYLGAYEDETAAAVKTFIPALHVLESWGDVRGVDGTAAIVQPLIAPLWSGQTAADLLAAFVGEGDRGTHALLRDFWQRRAVSEGWLGGVAGGFDVLWETWLARGVIEKSEIAPIADLALDANLVAALPAAVAAAEVKGDGLEVAFAVDPKVFDGRFANSAWAQELPHPITKITWDNAVLASQATAASLGLKTGDIVRLEVGDRPVTGPFYVQPGHADDAVTVALGYGRGGAEHLARGLGFNAGVLRTSDAFWFVRGARLSKTARGYRFGITQDHWSMEGRDPVRVADVAELRDADGKFYKELSHQRGKLPVIHRPVDYSGQAYKWAMAIDLSKCSGCNACVVACQSENNIPVVGRDNVRIGREMHWIRLDRYYEGDLADPQVVTQPVTCQHCETAPCEYVCPVNATVHSDEGLNEMVYNRCIGTRYCSNNCPYKARRFNFLDYHDDVPQSERLAANPDVTVRSRGIMEKCTYCVQRIERARIDTRIEGRAIADGEIKTACQQVCPSGAITFGSLNDPDSAVSRAHEDPRRYDLLHELGTRPRTAYLARVRNPHPELA